MVFTVVIMTVTTETLTIENMITSIANDNYDKNGNSIDMIHCTLSDRFHHSELC